jgi:hypothetical protein
MVDELNPGEHNGLTLEQLKIVSKQEAEIDALLLASKTNKSNNTVKVVLGDVESRIENDLRKGGFDIDLSGYKHEIDISGVRHAFNRHGDSQKEARIGQIAITEVDIKRIPYIIACYDKVEYGGKSGIGLDVIVYSKKINGTIVFVEEVRTGKKTLILKSMWKYKT